MLPFYAQQELESELNAQSDYLSEAYGATARDCDMMAEQDEEYQRYMMDQHSKYEATLKATTVWAFIGMVSALISNGHNRSDVIEAVMVEFTKYRATKWDANYADVTLADLVALHGYVEEAEYLSDVYEAFEAHKRDNG